MRPMVVVIMSPWGQLAACVGQVEEHFHVQTLITQLTVEVFDIAVLDRPPWPDEIQMRY
jgi:hypothetical protein